MNLKEKALKSVFWVGSAKGLGQVSSLVVTVILARLLLPSDFGLMAMAMVFLLFTEAFYEMGIGVLIIHKENIDKTDLNTCFWLSFFAGILLCIITFFIAPIISLFFRAERLETILRIISINFILKSFSTVPLNLLTKELEFKKRSSIEFTSDLLSGLIAVGCAIKGLGVWSLVARSLSRGVIFTVLIYIFNPWRPSFLFSLDRMKKALRFVLPVIGHRVLWYLYSHSDYLIVGRFLGDHILGLYRVAYLLSRKPLEKMWLVLGEIYLPVFSKLQKEKAKLRSGFLKFAKYVSIVIFPANTGLILVGEDIISTVLGQKWHPMILPFQLLCLLGILKTFDIGVFPLFNAIGKPELNLKFSYLACIIIPLSLLIGVNFGLAGVCIAWITAYPILSIIKLRFALKELSLSSWQYLKIFFDPFLGTLFMAFTVILSQFALFSSSIPLHRLIYSCTIGISSYSFFMLLLSNDFKNGLKDIYISLLKSRQKYAIT